MKRKHQPTFGDYCDAVAAMPPPRSQAEWRQVSTAIRKARRHNVAKIGRTISLECGAGRRLYLESTWGGMSCYNGPSPLRMVAMIGHQAAMYRQGLRGGRLLAGRDFAGAARRDGPVALP